MEYFYVKTYMDTRLDFKPAWNTWTEPDDPNEHL